MRHKKILTRQNNSGKSAGEENNRLRIFSFCPAKKQKAGFLRRRAAFSLALFAARLKKKNLRQKNNQKEDLYTLNAKGYDPELVYVECGRCGAPVLWEEGRATALLKEAGIDPLELDPSCILVTDGCPACGSSKEYAVKIFRIASSLSADFPRGHGHA